MTGAPRPRFTVVRRGYAPAEVDAYLNAPAGTPVPRFTITRRGYDPTEVDACLGRADPTGTPAPPDGPEHPARPARRRLRDVFRPRR